MTYTAIDGTENIGPREFGLLDIVPRSHGMLVKENSPCRFIEKDSRVQVTSSEAIEPSLPEQTCYHLNIREGENLDVGTANI